MTLSRQPGSANSRQPMARELVKRIIPLEGHWFLGQAGNGSFYVRLALLSSLLQAVVVIGLEIVIYRIYSEELAMLKIYSNEVQNIQKARIISAYHLIFIVAQVFQLVLCIDAVFRQDTIQIIGLAGFNFLNLVYSAVQLYQTSQAVTPSELARLQSVRPDFVHHASQKYEIAIIVILALLAVIFAVQAWHLFQEFGWRIYKKMGADLNIRRMYRVHQIFVAILKFDVFFFLAFAGQLWFILYESENTMDMIVHSVISLGGSICILTVAFWADRVESRNGMYCFMAGVLGTMGYLLYRLVTIFVRTNHHGDRCNVEIRPSDLKDALCNQFNGAQIFLTLFLVCTEVMGAITLVIARRVQQNFGKGLKYRLHRRQDDPDYELGGRQSATGDPALPRQQRWSIE